MRVLGQRLGIQSLTLGACGQKAAFGGKQGLSGVQLCTVVPRIRDGTSESPRVRIRQAHSPQLPLKRTASVELPPFENAMFLRGQRVGCTIRATYPRHALRHRDPRGGACSHLMNAPAGNNVPTHGVDT
jgi:hypothetical protein